MNVAPRAAPRSIPTLRRLMGTRRLWGGVALITLLGGVLRFATLDVQSFWLDEAFTLHGLRQPFAQTVEDVLMTQAQPPTYFMLAWGWIKVFGDGEVGLRSLSAVFGTATIPVAWAIGATALNRRAGLLLALFTALAPPLIWYSQEARAYALMILLSALSLLFFVRLLRAPRQSDLWLWAGASVLAIATHYFAIFLVLAEGAWLAVRVVDRRRDWPPFVALGIGLVLLAPVVLFQREHGGADWIGLLDLDERLRTATAFAVGGQIVPEPFSEGWWFPAIVLALFVVAAVGAVWRTRGAARTRAAAVLTVGLVGLALPLLAAAAGSDFVLDRNLLPIWLPLVAVVAIAIAAARPPVALAAALLLTGWFVYMDVRGLTEEKLQREDWRDMSRAIGPAKVDRLIEMDPWWHMDPLKLYATPILNYDAPHPVTEVITFTYEGYVPFDEPRSTRPPPRPFREVKRFQEGDWRVVVYRSPRPVAIDPAEVTGVGHAKALPFLQPAGGEPEI